jgi:ADP-ribose pyrophosphatase
VDSDRIRYPDGSEAEVDIVRHPGASAVVPFLSDPEGEDPQILLLRQYRYAADGYLYEIPAGRLDPGETPADCAARELKEETGCTATQMEPLITMVTTPGFTDERIHLFMAVELTHGEAAREADEFADVMVMRLSEALELIQRGEIVDGKTALGILYAAGFKTG